MPENRLADGGYPAYWTLDAVADQTTVDEPVPRSEGSAIDVYDPMDGDSPALVADCCLHMVGGKANDRYKQRAAASACDNGQDR